MKKATGKKGKKKKETFNVCDFLMDIYAKHDKFIF